MLAEVEMPSRQVRAKRNDLKKRTREVLCCEIGFIPNPRFREMDDDRIWRRELAVAEDDSATDTPASSGGFKMAAHLQRMCAAPLLSVVEERDLFCRLNYVKYRANSIRSTLNASRPSTRKLNEIEQLLSKANQLRNHIVNANTRLVISIVKKIADDKNSFDDLLSEGISCLLKAVEKFDFDRGFRFSTYATLAVRREVFRFIKRTHRDRSRFATGTNEVLDQQFNGDMQSERTESFLSRLDNRMSRMLTRLDEREQFIVKARHGLIDLGMKPTFSRLGAKLGVSKERARQIEMRAMDKLRDLVDEFQLTELSGVA